MHYARLFITCIMIYSCQIISTNKTFAAKIIESWEAIGLSIWDGNNIDVSKDGKIHRIILATIMAPQRGQPYSKESRMTLKNLVYGQKIQINVIRYDRYGRLIAEIKIGETNVNAEMVKTGMSWVYRRFNDDESLVALEEIARKNKTGLWRDENSIEPWEYRKSRRQNGQQLGAHTDSASPNNGTPVINMIAPALNR